MTTPPISDAPLHFSFVTPTHHYLSDGTRLHLLHYPGENVVSLTMGLHVGAIYDEILGETTLTAQLLTLGTALRSAEELAVDVERRGCSLSSTADRDAVTIHASGLSEHAAWLAETMVSCLLQPRLDASELETVKRRRLADTEMNMTDPDWLAAHAMLAVQYPAHPYANPRDGIPSSIAQVDAAVVARVHSRMVAAPRDVVIAGGFDVEAVLATFERAMAAAPATAPLPPPPAVQAMAATACVVDRSEAVQTVLRIAMPSVGMSHPSLAPQNLAITILGGYTLARLFSVLREEKGYTYGAYATNEIRRYGQALVMHTSVGNDFTKDTLDVIAEQVRSLQRFDVNLDEVERARQFMLGTLARSTETPQQAAGMAWNVMQYGLAPDHYTQYAAALQRTTRDELQAVSASLFDVRFWTIAAVGRASVLAEALAGHVAHTRQWDTATMCLRPL